MFFLYVKFFLIYAILVSLLVGCFINPVEESLEQRAIAIEKLLICPVCPSETIHASQVPVSKQMRDLVKILLSEGMSDEEILAFFVSRYGQDILTEPSRDGFSNIVWIIPPIILPIVFILLILFLYKRTKDANNKIFVEDDIVERKSKN